MAGKGTTIQMTAAHVKYLEQRGAQSHRGGGTFSRSVVLGRMLDALRLYQEATDPRQTRGLPAAMHEALVRLVPEPWGLKPYEVATLEILLGRSPGWKAAAQAAGIDPEALLAAVAAMSLAEKLTLVDQAVQAQAPAAAGASPEEP